MLDGQTKAQAEDAVATVGKAAAAAWQNAYAQEIAGKEVRVKSKIAHD
eukprot:COSAG01_NODE_7821_length_3042_cov_2.604145_2_plen_48_part_00